MKQFNNLSSVARRAKEDKTMKKGFTLIELLIAATIFVIIMVIVTGTFTWTASYNSKLREMRRVTQDGRKVIEQLSREIRLANGSATVTDGSAPSPAPTRAVGEVTFFDCSSVDINSCKFAYTINTQINPMQFKTESSGDMGSIGSPDQSKDVNAILILNKDNDEAVFYISIQPDITKTNYDFLRRKVDFIRGINLASDFKDMYQNTTQRTLKNSWAMMNDFDTSLELGFAGYGPAKVSTKNQQPYAEFGLRSQTWDYDTVLLNYRAQFDLKTTVETRDYN